MQHIFSAKDCLLRSSSSSENFSCGKKDFSVSVAKSVSPERLEGGIIYDQSSVSSIDKMLPFMPGNRETYLVFSSGDEESLLPVSRICSCAINKVPGISSPPKLGTDKECVVAATAAALAVSGALDNCRSEILIKNKSELLMSRIIWDDYQRFMPLCDYLINAQDEVIGALSRKKTPRLFSSKGFRRADTYKRILAEFNIPICSTVKKARSQSCARAFAVPYRKNKIVKPLITINGVSFSLKSMICHGKGSYYDEDYSISFYDRGTVVIRGSEGCFLEHSTVPLTSSVVSQDKCIEFQRLARQGNVILPDTAYFFKYSDILIGLAACARMLIYASERRSFEAPRPESAPERLLYSEGDFLSAKCSKNKKGRRTKPAESKILRRINRYEGY